MTMKTLLIITFVISILANHILCLTETPLLTDKNNTKNDTTESNIHDKETNNTTHNNTIYKNFNIEYDFELFESMSPILIKTIFGICGIIIGLTFMFYCRHPGLSLRNRPAQNQFHTEEFPLRRTMGVLDVSNEVELLCRRIEREVNIQEETELQPERRIQRVRIQDRTAWHHIIMEPIDEETEM